ncbi:hypothetical protein [Streptomyces sp. TP-A0874]|uniref:hypothetical protein n=1 Tax=Streptomyces sp. TP-A0874 TaxID=549819 RepID=UPI000853A1EF|nr:hypothetical protein [Streptomyces sp. TP-A0874]
MPDVSPLLTAVDRLADRLRAAPQSRLRRGAAAEGLALARSLAERAQRIEFPGREPRLIPDAGELLVADQLAVAGHDLAEALLTGEVVGEEAERQLTEALAEVAEAARRCGL